jgi:hypothetical protein
LIEGIVTILVFDNENGFKLEASVCVGSVNAVNQSTASSSASRKARRLCSDYLRMLGIDEPDVLARVSLMLLHKAEEQVSGCAAESVDHRLIKSIVEVTDGYVQKWIASIEKQIDLHGGTSRCGEVAMRMPKILAEHPQAIESVELAVSIFRADSSLSMPANPPNNPTKFASQPIVGIRGKWLAGLLAATSLPFRSRFPAHARRHA